MARRKFREEKSKFYGTKQVLQDLNAPAHLAVHELDAVVLGIPAGGLQGQVLVKLSNDDYDVGWADATSLFPAIVDGGDAPTAPGTIIDGGNAPPLQENTMDGGTS